MAFGGGSFVSQNKVLPGVYVNVAAGSKMTGEIADRGVAAIGVELSWGAVNEPIYLTESEFRQQAKTLLGYDYAAEPMKGLRDLFKGAAACYVYRLNGGTEAVNSLARAKYPGKRGNDLQVAVSESDGKYLVATLLDGEEVDSQLVSEAAELKDNDYLVWQEGIQLEATAVEKLADGTDGSVSNSDYTTMFEKLEGVNFNVLAGLSTNESVNQLFVQYTREQRENCGKKFQTVLYKAAADYEGVISLENSAQDENWPESAGVYWLAGAEAGCAVNSSLTNALYSGEFELEPMMGQANLQQALSEGKLVLHKLNDRLRVLEDINTLVSVGETGEDMRLNQTVRVLDQIVCDLSTLFYDKYLGVVLNDNAGRVSLWNDIVTYYRKLENLRAIEAFDTGDIVVEQGDSKKAVKISSYLTVVSAMSQLYLTVTFE